VVDWSAWLGDDTIESSTFEAPAGLTKVDEDSDGTTATVWLSGGTDTETYEVVNQIVTAGGRTDERTITFKVAHK
jgi:hypothetical protein